MCVILKPFSSMLASLIEAKIRPKSAKKLFAIVFWSSFEAARKVRLISTGSMLSILMYTRLTPFTLVSLSSSFM